MTSPQPVTDELAALNEDRLLWTSGEDGYYSRYQLYVTKSGAITLCETGHCVTKSPEAWFSMTRTYAPQPTLSEDEAVEKLAAAHRALMAAQQKGEK